MHLWRLITGVLGCLMAVAGHCQVEELWLIEQDAVRYGKREAYETYKKEQQKDFVKKVGFSRYAIEDADAGQYIYLIPVQDFRGLNMLMDKRSVFHKKLSQEDATQLLPFMSTIKFFIESVHRELPGCSFVPAGKESLLDYTAVAYCLYGVMPGNGPLFEEKLRRIVAVQEESEAPVSFRTWRVVFGGDEPSYLVAVFADSAKEAKKGLQSLRIGEGQIKNILRQERKGSGFIRKDLSAVR